MSNLNTLFTKVNQEYHIVITEEEGQAIADNPATVKKLIDSNKIREVETVDGNEFHLVIEKKGSLLVGETQELQKAISVESSTSLMSIMGDLLAEGYSQSEADGIVQDMSKWSKLKQEHVHKLLMILRESALPTSKDATILTGVMSLRVYPSWELSDTLRLPVSLYDKILEFVQGESTGWANENEEDKKKTVTTDTAQLITIEEKQKEKETV